ncbi:MAG: FliM/FliN family flagellar motor C-terminal domain-containing protein [Erythrobacter sp.]
MNMSPSFSYSFANARPIAEHCAELTWRGPRPEERAENLTAWRRDLGSELSQELGQLFSGGKFKVALGEPEFVTGETVFERVGVVAANSLLRCGEGDQTMLFSLDYPTAIALTDCSFGGDGHTPEETPAQLPRSAALLIEKVASLVAQVVVMSSGGTQRVKGDVLVRSESVTRLKPFGGEAQVAFFPITMGMSDGAQWNAILAVANDRLDDLLPGANFGTPTDNSNRLPSDGTTGPFAAMPLSLEAVLGEFSLSLSKLNTLAPGDEIPLAMQRELPLRVGDQTVVHGTLGTVENRMALRVTRLPKSAINQPFTPANTAPNDRDTA